MKLPAIPFLTKSVVTEYFLSLLFEKDKVVGILFKDQNKNLTVIAQQETKIDLATADLEGLISACDKVISKLEVNLPEETELSKTIFTVPHSWVEEGKITSDRLSDLKKISVELALSPVGFIVSIEAIVVYLQKKEGAPINGIFVELSDRTLEVFLVRGGNIIEVKKGKIVDGVEKTVEVLLESVEKFDVLPAKIVLLNNEEGEKIQQRFLAYQWTKNLPFQHLPQVSILDRNFENESIIHGVAAQMGAALVGGKIPKPEIVEDFGFEEGGQIEENDDFGFVKEQDIKEKPKEEASVVEEKEEIVVNDHRISETKVESGEEVYEDDYSEEVQEDLGNTKKSLPAVIGSIIPKKVKFKMPQFGNPFTSGRSILIPIGALIVVVLLLVGYYNFFLKANIIIFTDQKEFNDSLGITLASNGESSFENKTLRIETVNEQVGGEDTQETTGTLETGEKAKGELTIFNKTEDPKSLNKGSIVVSSNGLEYQIDEEIKIASTSSFSTTFTSQKVKVTASDFGKEYNIPSNTNFTIKGTSTSDLFAKNDNAFSGGSKEELKVVSSKDIQILTDTLTKKLFEKAKKQANDKLGADEALIPVILSSKFDEKDFDKKEKDKADNVKLKAQITFTLGIYKKEELNKFISSSNDLDIPKDFKFSDEDSEITVSDVKQNKKDISAKLTFNAIFRPTIEVDKIPESVKGKGLTQAQDDIKSITGVSDATIILSNKLPVLPNILPLSARNISVELKTQ